VRQDAAGNVFARWEGGDPSLAPVVTGSHIDAIPNAGKYDGVVGVLGGLEAVCALRQAGFQPVRPIEIVTFTSEEPTRFGLGCLGSRLLAGTLAPEQARLLRDAAGGSLDALRRRAGCMGELDEVPLPAGALHCFIELHIEQGPILEREGLDIGAVEKIAGPAAFRVRLSGEGGHAGAVLMPDRHDAGLAAAEIALAVERAATDSGSGDTVGTTGVFRIEPGAINSVPARALIEIDLRDTDLATRDQAEREIRDAVAAVCARRGVSVEFEVINADAPAVCDPELVEAILGAAQSEGFRARRMISRAYHDSLFMARACPAAMIFIPCRNGWSHRPDEFASVEAITRGVQTLAGVLARMAGPG